MKHTARIVSIAIVTTFSSSMMSSCEEKESQAEISGSKSSEKNEKKKKYKASDMMKILREVDNYKKKIGYEDPAEVRALEQELSNESSQLNQLKRNHPTLKRIEQESAEARSKLMQAVADNDEAGKEKWGEIVAGHSSNRLKALAEIPEIVALEKSFAEKEAKQEALEYDELAKTPEGKKLADKLKEVTDSVLGR